MDNKSFIAQLSKRADISQAQTARMAEALTNIIKTHAADLDSIAVPGFGTLAAEKVDEKVVTDLSTNKRLLLPPAITLMFTPGAKLRNAAHTK